MSTSPRHDKSPNDNVDDEIEEGLEEAFQFPVEAEYENNKPHQCRRYNHIIGM